MHAEVTIETGPDAGQQQQLQPGRRIVLGRGSGADLLIKDEKASREHVALRLTPDGLEVTDLGSRNGTLLGGCGLPPNAPARVAVGDVLQIGACRILLRVVDAAGGAAGEEAPLPIAEEFELLSELGQGGPRQVFAARHKASGRMVAVKVLLENVGGDDPRLRQRFLRETRVRIDSPHVVQTYDVRIEQGQVWMILELVTGSTAEHRLEQGPLSVAEALWIGEQVALALAAAHRLDVVHRDVKPANILITPERVAKLSDFGVAKVVASSQSLTVTGERLGTTAYAAPEQLRDARSVTPRSDLYSLGASLYRLITGHLPFQPGPDLAERIVREAPPPLSQARPDCPAEVVALVESLLEKEPGDRPGSAEEVARRLRELRMGLGV